MEYDFTPFRQTIYIIINRTTPDDPLPLELLIEKYYKLENIIIKKFLSQDDKFILVQIQNIRTTLTHFNRESPSDRAKSFVIGLKADPLLYPMV